MTQVKHPRLEQERTDGLDADEFIRRTADPTWPHQHEMREDLEAAEPPPENRSASPSPSREIDHDDADLPFRFSPPPPVPA